MASDFTTPVSERTVLWVIVACLLGGLCFGQTLSIARVDDKVSGITEGEPLKVASVPAMPVIAYTLPDAHRQHRFWDRQNRILFAAVAALSAADFAVTRENLQNGGKELNPVTRLFSGSTAGLAVNFAGETAGILGLSYYLHKTGHHRLERIAPLINLGASSFAVGFDLSHR